MYDIKLIVPLWPLLRHVNKLRNVNKICHNLNSQMYEYQRARRPDLRPLRQVSVEDVENCFNEG